MFILCGLCGGFTETDKGECAWGQRSVQGDCAFILSGETGETWKGLDTWELCNVGERRFLLKIG